MTAEIEPGVHIIGDSELLTQMLVNLVENAIRHCPIDTRIMFGLRREGAAACVTVADHGGGIPPEELPKIVRPFYRLEQSRSSDGSGLGLALVDWIARLHRIRLRFADNQPGLKVSLWFPKPQNDAAIKP